MNQSIAPLEHLPENARLILEGDDNVAFPLLYFFAVEGRRPDVERYYNGMYPMLREFSKSRIRSGKVFWTHAHHFPPGYQILDHPWGLLAFIVGMIGGRALLWIWDLVVADASRLEIWFVIGVGVLFLVGALTFWVIGEVGYLGYRIERFRRALYLLCWDWVEACYVEPAEPTVSPRPAWVPSGPIEVFEPVTRSLTFPTHRSYGVVYHRPARDYWGGGDEWWPGAWDRFLSKLSNGEPAFPPAARGTVSVPRRRAAATLVLPEGRRR